MPQLDHVALRVSNLDRSIAFYRDKLGLAFLFKQLDSVHHEAFAFLQLEGGKLELLEKLDKLNRHLPYPAAEITAPFCPHVALVTDDMERLLERLARADVPIVDGPLEIPGTVRWVYVHDPDNNVIEFVHWIQAPSA